MAEKPETIENRWDILYRDYPEVYDEFASFPYDPPMMGVIHEMFNFTGKVIVDIGSGSGLSTFPLAKYAKAVIGVEPEKAMRELAEKKALELGISNIEFIEGLAEAIPLDEDAADVVTAFFAMLYPPREMVPLFVAEASRVVKPGGLVLAVDVAPGWYGGELAEVIGDEDADNDARAKHRAFVDDAGFSYKDIDQTQDYGSLEKIVGTYGFIFGRKAIDHLRAHNKTTMKWRFRMFYKIIEKDDKKNIVEEFNFIKKLDLLHRLSLVLADVKTSIKRAIPPEPTTLLKKRKKKKYQEEHRRAYLRVKKFYPDIEKHEKLHPNKEFNDYNDVESLFADMRDFFNKKLETELNSLINDLAEEKAEKILMKENTK